MQMVKSRAAYLVKAMPALFLLYSCALLLTACSRSKQNPDQQGSLAFVPDKIKDQIGRYEVQNLASQNIELLSRYPTLFEVASLEGKASYDRMLFFFQNYCSSYQPQNIHSEIKSMTVQTSGAADSVLYKVSRHIQGFNVKYAVSAADKNNPKKSAILAANLARFIREGQLDLELIDPKNR